MNIPEDERDEDTPRIGRSDYAERRKARIERLRTCAEQKHWEGEARLAAADRIAAQIPLGQPILVGHHSEGRARRDQKRIREGTLRGLDALKEADELERRAAAAGRSTAISSDDPEAIAKLRTDLADTEAFRDRWKAINRALRSRDQAKLESLELTAKERRAIALSESGTGYVLTNAGASIRRIKRRIEELTQKAAAPLREPETVGGIVIDEVENRVRLRFREKPPANLVRELKANGFRWTPSAGVWQRHASETAWHWARRIAKRATGIP